MGPVVCMYTPILEIFVNNDDGSPQSSTVHFVGNDFGTIPASSGNTLHVHQRAIHGPHDSISAP